MKTKFLLILAIFSVSATGIIVSDFQLERIVNQFVTFHKLYKPQKIYLHTDKNEYAAGEELWFSGYLLDAENHQLDTSQTTMYVDLVSPEKKVVQQRTLKVEKGIAIGDFSLKDTIAEGKYQLRAYTEWMKNGISEFFFVKTISIKNQKRRFFTLEYFFEMKSLAKKRQKIDVQFFAEGGNLVENIETQIAFKGTNIFGQPIDFQGIIFDKKKNEIVRFAAEHNGMGKFSFTPKSDTKYFAKIFHNGNEFRFDLPEIEKKGLILNVSKSLKNTEITVKTNQKISQDVYANSFYLVGQMRGKIYFAEKKILDSCVYQFSIPDSIFPTGIAQFTLFKPNGEPVAERLTFIQHNDFPRVTIKTSREKEKIKFEISLNQQVAGFASLSAVQMPQVLDNQNIISNLLLTSDLTGNIENPAYYFDSQNENREKYLDLVMLTNGWRRFVWKKILTDSIPKPTFKKEQQLCVSGKINKLFFKLPSPNSPVTLTILNQYNDSYSLRTNEKGEFCFSNLNYYDTLDVLLEARSIANKKNILILLDEPQIPNVIFRSILQIDSQVFAMKKRYQKPRIYEKVDFNAEKKSESGIHQRADHIVRLTDNDRTRYSNIFQVLQANVPGIRVQNYGNSMHSTIRGPKSLVAGSDPLYLIDDMPVDDEAVNSLNIWDVDRIEILKGAGAAVYGSRGGNGVIAIYTQKGHFMKRGEINFKKSGFYRAKEFYSPKYTAETIFAQNKTIFWFPKIEIDKLGKIIISKNSDFKGVFYLCLEGISLDGKPFFIFQTEEIN